MLLRRADALASEQCAGDCIARPARHCACCGAPGVVATAASRECSVTYCLACFDVLREERAPGAPALEIVAILQLARRRAPRRRRARRPGDLDGARASGNIAQ